MNKTFFLLIAIIAVNASFINTTDIATDGTFTVQAVSENGQLLAVSSSMTTTVY
jgi:hypothetical protein